MFATVKTPELADRPITRLKAWSSGDWMDYRAESIFLSEHMDEGELDRLAHARMVAWSAVDAEGKPLFERPTVAQLKKAVESNSLKESLKVYFDLLEVRASVLSRVANAAVNFHGISTESEYELEKN